MSKNAESNQCPCESGFEYTACCAITDRAQPNVVANIASTQQTSFDNLPDNLRLAIQNIHQTPDLMLARLFMQQNIVKFLKMSEYWYSESVFCDFDRIMGSCVVDADLETMKRIADKIEYQSTPFIIHTAFCGSTLMSKLLDAICETLAIREPDAIGNLMMYMNAKEISEEDKKTWFDVVMKLFSRRYSATQVPIVKTNDFANGIVLNLMEWKSSPPVLFMYTPLKEFLSGCLKAENRRSWILGRYRAFASKAADVFDDESILTINDNEIGKQAAVYWSYNVSLFLRARKMSENKIRSLEFNQMLADPLIAVEACADWFGLSKREGVNVNDELNWCLGVYSKDATYDYSAEQRRKEIDGILQNNTVILNNATILAKRLLKDEYPDLLLPDSLLQ